MIKTKYKLYNKEQSPETRVEIRRCVEDILSANGTNFREVGKSIPEVAYKHFLTNIADMQIDIKHNMVFPEEIATKKEALRVLIPLIEELETPENIVIEKYNIKNGKDDILTFQNTNFPELELINQSGLDSYQTVSAGEDEVVLSMAEGIDMRKGSPIDSSQSRILTLSAKDNGYKDRKLQTKITIKEDNKIILEGTGSIREGYSSVSFFLSDETKKELLEKGLEPDEIISLLDRSEYPHQNIEFSTLTNIGFKKNSKEDSDFLKQSSWVSTGDDEKYTMSYRGLEVNMEKIRSQDWEDQKFGWRGTFKDAGYTYTCKTSDDLTSLLTNKIDEKTIIPSAEDMENAGDIGGVVPQKP